MDDGRGLGAGPTIIEPIDFRRAARPPQRGGSWRRRIATLLAGSASVILAVAAWFVLTARPVHLVVTPTPERTAIDGPALRLKLKDRLLLRTGSYVVRAERSGYAPLEAPFEVTRGGPTMFEFALRELPGLVSFRVVGGDDPDAPLDGAVVFVDGAEVGSAPLDGVEVERGPRGVRLARDRYQDLETEIEIEGFGARQSVTLEMRPDWATVAIESSPDGAEVFIDGVAAATTPCRIDVLSGPHEIELRKDRFEVWRTRIDVVAETPIALGGIALTPARGRILVEADPVGAQVVIGDDYAGAAPVEAEVAPDTDLPVRVAADGYVRAEQTVRVGPGEETTVTFELTPEFGVVLLRVEPMEARLSIDGQPYGMAPPEITLPAREHRLEFTKDGFEPAVRTIRPRPGVPGLIEVTLAPIVPEAPQPSEAEIKGWPAANGYAFELIRPASFTMGASRREQGRRSNETLRRIELTRPYLLGRREVTNEEFRAFKPEHRSGRYEEIPLDAQTQPVVQVSWDDAARFCNWLSARDGLPAAYVAAGDAMEAVTPPTTGYRLPTEAEWEYAARANGTEPLLKYPWGATYPPRKKVGNFADESAFTVLKRRIRDYDDGYAGPAPVGKFEPNPQGLFDIGGNVAEWCHDFYSIYTYDADAVAVDPTGPESGQYHVVRGASWRNASISFLRLAYRDYGNDTRDDLGFRICRYLTKQETPDADQGDD
jgi:formylglycine-generating enzyme required for sulfatase activity